MLSSNNFRGFTFWMPHSIPLVASGPSAAYLWPPNCYSFTICFGWVSTCIPVPVSMPTIHRQLGHSLLQVQFLSFTFHFRFWSSSHIYILPAAGASSLLKEKWSVKICNLRKNVLKHLHLFSLQPAPMCLICQETIAVMKISNLKQHYETKNKNFEEPFPPWLYHSHWTFCNSAQFWGSM